MLNKFAKKIKQQEGHKQLLQLTHNTKRILKDTAQSLNTSVWLTHYSDILFSSSSNKAAGFTDWHRCSLGKWFLFVLKTKWSAMFSVHAVCILALSLSSMEFLTETLSQRVQIGYNVALPHFYPYTNPVSYDWLRDCGLPNEHHG